MATVPSEHANAGPASDELDDELEALQARVKALRQRRAVQASTILSSRASKPILQKLRPPPSKTPQAEEANPLHLAVLDTAQKQAAHNQECLYRITAGVTTFKVRDPDPYAVDQGAVVGVRIEAFQGGRYVRPYYVFLNRPFDDSGILRVHRHTVPPCIPLAALAERWLPAPNRVGDLLKKKQSLTRFIRALKLQITAYHNRVAVIASMRNAFGLESKRGNKGKGRESGLADVSAADAEARQIRLEWLDGRIGRAVMDDKGQMAKCVVIGEQGRDRDTERRILGGDSRVEGLAERLLV